MDFLFTNQKCRKNPSLPSVLHGDELRIKQIITNLLSNAVKYTEKGDVTLSCKVKERKNDELTLLISVADTGIGIKETEREKLFSAFDRLDVVRTRSIEGTGLGLLIDDDDDFRTVMGHWLGNIYRVISAASGREAIHAIKAGTSPDLILLDYEMPEFNGYDVMEKLHRNPETVHIPIIFLTGRNDQETIATVLNKKPDGYLLKTVKKTELLDRLDRFFAESILRHGKYPGAAVK